MIHRECFMSFHCIRYLREGNIATVVLNRPEKLNALNATARSEIVRALQESREDKDVRVLILSGNERAFCAGADIEELRAINTTHGAYRHSRDFQRVFDEVERFPKPTIAAIGGYALGGGFELALACDFRIAAEGARFGLPEVVLGAIPAGGGTQRLPRAIGTAKAKEILFLGEPIDAQEAWRIGLVNRVVSADQLLHEANAIARKLVTRPALALETLKAVVDTGSNLDLSSAIELEARSFAMLFSSRDFVEGTTAFVEKRPPAFIGE
jgi:enoyl-CoA hydratase